MSPSISALLGFVALTLGLVFIVVLYRVFLSLSGKTPANSWTRGAQTWNDSALITRLSHAHLNALETLPLFASVILVAAYTGNTQITDPTACWFLIARLGQALVHAIGVSHWLVFIRANFLVVQWALLIYWLIALCAAIA